MSFLTRLLTGPSGTGSSGTGSGRGGALGTPSLTLDESPPSRDQESNAVVSGGGLVGADEDHEPGRAARQSPSSQAP
jgi:hypothetical protein